MAEKPAGHILIECPNTIFHLYARDEGELSKIETFLRNIRGIKRLGLNDIYIWCNRQGILYVTNQRIVFQASEWGFDKMYRYLTAVTPYVDGCEIQFGNKSYNIIVADGNLLNKVLQLVQQRRQIP